MINPINIVKGWFASKIYASYKTKQLSKQRLKHCQNCINTRQSKVLKIINGDLNEIETLLCKGCSKKIHCPVVEKSLVKEETCPLKKWEL